MVKLIKFRKLFTFLLLFGHISSRSAPSFRVVAPQTICEKSSRNNMLLDDPQSITISFYPRNGERLIYKFQIFFKILGNSRTQRRTLELWKSVRNLEERINFRDRSQISERNLLTLTKSELLTGVVYIFHVIGTTSKRVTSRGQNFTIKYLSGKFQQNDVNLSSSVNLLLLGSEYILASIPFTLVAKVLFCKPRFDYYFQWNIPGLEKEYRKYLQTSRSTLTIPEQVLKAGQEYEIEASLLQSNVSKKPITQSTFSVSVIKRRPKLFIFPKRITTGKNQPIKIEVIINDYNMEKVPFEISWTSVSSSERRRLCETCDKINNKMLKTSFDEVGKYIVIATVKKGEDAQSIFCEINVESSILLYYDFYEAPNLFVTQGQSFQFTLLVNNVLPNCMGEWITVPENGFESFPRNGTDLGKFKINDMDRNYLLELSEFGNSTVSREVQLFIPESSGDFEGLKGDSKYKIRMIVTCPSLLVQHLNGKQERRTESLFEFIIVTNSPPRGAPLEVKPLKGLALQTVFQFTTGDAKDVETDAPLLYEFLYKINNFTLSIGTFYEYRTVETVLPYSDSSIETMYKVCDIRSACSILQGPKIQVSTGEVIFEQVQQRQEEIILSFQRMDFYAGQCGILSSALTYQKLNDQNLYNDFKNFSKTLLSKEIDKQYERPTETMYLSHEDMYKFIRLTKQNFEVLDINDTDMFRKLLDLLESTTEEEQEEEETLVENIEVRRKRQMETINGITRKSIVDSDFALLSLELLERWMKSLDKNVKQTERTLILEKVNQLALKMCKSNKTSVENIRTNLVTLKIWKLKGKQIMGKRFPIEDYKTPKTGNFTLYFSELKSTKKFCLTLIHFSEDHFSGFRNVPIYNLILYDEDTLLSEREIYMESKDKNGVELLLPEIKGAEKCLMWSNAKWTSEYCESKIRIEYTLCKCQRLGYVKLGTDSNEIVYSTTAVSLKSTHYLQPVTSLNNPDSTKSTPRANHLGDDIINSSPLLYTLAPTDALLDQNTTNSESNLFSATLIDYVLPFICILSVLLIIGGLVLYQRKRRIEKNQVAEIDAIEPRESVPGIKYGKFYDEHVLRGKF